MLKKRSMFSCFVLNICKWPENVFKDPKYAKSTLKMFRYLILYTLEQHFLARKASYKVFYQKHASSSKSQKKIIVLKQNVCLKNVYGQVIHKLTMLLSTSDFVYWKFLNRKLILQTLFFKIITEEK